MEHKNTFEIIKKEFCSIFSFKTHGDTLEVITPFATITDKFISVFVTERNGKIIVADGGWIEENIYEHPLLGDDKEILEIVVDQYLHHFAILTTIVKGRGKVYYKSTTKFELLPACVFDLANFIVSTVNANALDYKTKHEKEERDKFRTETNNYLKLVFKDDFKANQEISQGIKYNGVITRHNKLHLLEYVTGHTPYYFDRDLYRVIVNFQLVESLFIHSHVANKIAIFNDKSAGYEQGVSPIIVEHLSKFTTRDFITRSNIDIIKDIISN